MPRAMSSCESLIHRDAPGAGADDLTRLANRINAICRNATMELAFKVGELVIEALYDSDIEGWLEDRGRTASFRSLASRGDLLMSPSALCRAVGVYVVAKRLDGFRRWRHLSSSHLQEILPLPPAEQNRILERAESEEWTVARLREEVRLASPARGHGASQTRLVSSLRQVHQRLRQHNTAFPMTTSPRRGGVTQSESLLHTIALIRDELDRLETLLCQSEDCLDKSTQ